MDTIVLDLYSKKIKNIQIPGMIEVAKKLAKRPANSLQKNLGNYSVTIYCAWNCAVYRPCKATAFQIKIQRFLIICQIQGYHKSIVEQPRKK